MMAWLVDAVGTTLAVVIVVAILAWVFLGALVCYLMCVISGRAAQAEEDELGWRRS